MCKRNEQSVEGKRKTAIETKKQRRRKKCSFNIMISRRIHALLAFMTVYDVSTWQKMCIAYTIQLCYVHTFSKIALYTSETSHWDKCLWVSYDSRNLNYVCIIFIHITAELTQSQRIFLSHFSVKVKRNWWHATQMRKIPNLIWI